MPGLIIGFTKEQWHRKEFDIGRNKFAHGGLGSFRENRDVAVDITNYSWAIVAVKSGIQTAN